MDISLSKLQELVTDREAWRNAVPGVTESGKSEQRDVHHHSSLGKCKSKPQWEPLHTKMAKIKKTDNKCGKNMEKWAPRCTGGDINGAAALENISAIYQ